MIKFQPNRVRRLYLGGSGIDRMRGNPPHDDYYPEDWIASCIEGNTREYVAPGHGLSQVEIDGKSCCFKELLAQHSEYCLGARHVARLGVVPGVLVKLLDSAVRLPVQVHPTVPAARKYFGASCGKTEAWIILNSRPGAGIYLGFNDKLDREVFRRESLNGEYVRGLDMLHRIEVKPGDTIVVHGGLPHAIGAGITMVEVMEPSDLTVNPERRLGDKVLDETKRFAGLPPETALELFDWMPYSLAEIKARCFQTPEPLGPHRQCLIDREKIGFFGVESLQLNGSCDLPHRGTTFLVMVVVEGKIRINDNETELRAGESAFLPYQLEKCCLHGNGRVIFILPPQLK